MDNFEVNFGSLSDWKKTKGFVIFSAILFFLIIIAVLIVALIFTFDGTEKTENVLKIGTVILKSNHIGAFVALTDLIIGFFYFKFVLRIMLNILRG